MISERSLSPEILESMMAKGVDIKHTLSILSNFNRGLYERRRETSWQFPDIAGENIVDLKTFKGLSLPYDRVAARLEKLPLEITPDRLGSHENDTLYVSSESFVEVGQALFPHYAMGVLNGGAATSYADKKKNKQSNPDLFALLEKEIVSLAERSSGMPKGVTPAFINSDGTPGPSFLEIRLRGLLWEAVKHQRRGGDVLKPLLFQMVSTKGHVTLREELEALKKSPFLTTLMKDLPREILTVPTGIQPLLTAFTHSQFGEKKEIFLRYGENQRQEVLPLPGGHGECFRVLKEILGALSRQGKWYISLGNIDNLGYVFDPLALGIFAISGKPVAFNFSHKSSVDTKGGVLVSGDKGHLNCVDIGAGISSQQVEEAEREGKSVLFNCATALFDLDYLLDHLDWIIETLPIRFVDQDKDAGLYSQAEQITWEVMSLIEDPLIFIVDKRKRFLAAKTIIDTLMISGSRLSEYPKEISHLQGLAAGLNDGLKSLLQDHYGMHYQQGCWTALERFQ